MLESLQQPKRVVSNSPQGSPQMSIPDYFQTTSGYKTLSVGHKSNTYKIVNEPVYDCYIIAGVEDNELVSKLIMTNLQVTRGIAFDPNTNKISSQFPDNVQMFNKQISFKNDTLHENLHNFNDAGDIFLKMNIYGGEYLWVLSLPYEKLQNFKQMVIVFHDINNNPTQQRAMNKIKCFQKLHATHDIVHIEPAGENITVTYFRKDSCVDTEIASSDIVSEAMSSESNTDEPVNNGGEQEAPQSNAQYTPDGLLGMIEQTTMTASKQIEQFIVDDADKNVVNEITARMTKEITQLIRVFASTEEVVEGDAIQLNVDHNNNEQESNPAHEETAAVEVVESRSVVEEAHEETAAVEVVESRSVVEEASEEANQMIAETTESTPQLEDKPKGKNAKKNARRSGKKKVKIYEFN